MGAKIWVYLKLSNAKPNLFVGKVFDTLPNVQAALGADGFRGYVSESGEQFAVLTIERIPRKKQNRA